MSRPPAGRIAYLDGIRTVAILAVIGSHWGGSYLGLFQGGYVGVDLFFVLSGYIITKIVWRRRASTTYGAFLVGRVRRLYPALLGVVAVTVLLIAVIKPMPLGQAGLGGVFALTQLNSIVEGLDLASSDPFGVTWSLSAEWIFYLVWPCILLFGRKLTARQVGAIAAGVALVLFLSALPMSADWFYYGPASRGAQLLVGSAVALLTIHWKPDQVLHSSFGAAALLSIMFVILWTLFGPEHLSPLYRFVGYPLTTAAATALVLIGLAQPRSWVTWLLSIPWVAAIGRASYSLYLWHVIPVMVLDKDVMNLPGPVLAVVGVAATVVFTWLSYRYLERPFLAARATDIEPSISHSQPTNYPATPPIT